MMTPMLAFLVPDALANGQTVHVQIMLGAREGLPDGVLRDFVQDDDVFAALVHGAMFPDGGYAVHDGYGELAHWEPFQSGWLAHVRETCGSPPYDDVECQRRAAFLLGMAAHGMADQYYDATYQDRASRVYDATADWAGSSMDEATDVVYTSEHGPVDLPDRWLPSDELAPIFGTAVGHTVTPDTLESGQDLLELAIAYVALAAAREETVAEYRAQFPWGTSHLDDPTVPGHIAEVSVVVARYWEVLWRRLSGDEALEPAVIYTNPAGGYAHPTSADDIESRVSVVMARGLSQAGFDTSAWNAIDEDGVQRPFTSTLYYREASHVVNLAPTDGWSADAEHTVFVAAGMPAFDGATLGGPSTFTFSTAAPPIDTSSDSADTDTPRACGCASSAQPGGPIGMLALLLVRRRYSQRSIAVITG
jgi:hypothetical protein